MLGKTNPIVRIPSMNLREEYLDETNFISVENGMFLIC